MSAGLQDMLNFHLTGRRGSAVEAPTPDACPALLAPYRRLEALRYDFPLVLLASADTPAFADSLTGIFNRLLREIAPEGDAGELLRQHVLRLERRMRTLAAGGGEATLTALWKRAEKSLLADCDDSEAESLGNSIATARFALRRDGQVVDCDDRLPARLLQHAWSQREARRSATTLERINTLIVGLRNILKVDDLKAAGARTPQKLKMTLGKRYREAFDFDLMAELLNDSAATNRLPRERRRRIREALETLEKQMFFADPEVRAALRPAETYRFGFDTLAAALKAYHERLPALAGVVRAMAIGELECDNAYQPDRHDGYFQHFGPHALGEEDLRQFPSYLVCLREKDCTSRDTVRLMEIVNCDLPMKVLVQVSDPLGEPSPVDGLPHQGTVVQQLTHSFVAGNAFVLQSPASGLLRQQEQVLKSLDFHGPSIVSVYVPDIGSGHALPAYLVAAAAMESRVFPAFSYDPAAGAGLADRFDISSNPNVEADWVTRQLQYEDEALQSVIEEQCFTIADFAVLDRHYVDHFARAERDAWGDDMLPVSDYLDRGEATDAVPYVAIVDADDRLCRWVVDDKLLRMTRRCRERWHALQELGGVNNSYAAAAHTAAVAEAEAAGASASPEPDTARVMPAPDSAEGAAAPADTADETGDATEAADEPWIETPRCTTCDECTNRNPRLFVYDDNRQATIGDPDAGTFRELVEAAETCQVAIIHPGKPRNPDEPGLEGLIERAAPFNA